MEYQEAKYIIDYFPRLMTPLERKALNHNMILSKIGKAEDYSDIQMFERRKNFFERRLGYDSNNKEVEELLKNGYEDFILRTGKRIKENSADEYIINRCPNCKAITRTPYAKLCLKCKLSWHSRIAANFLFEGLKKDKHSSNIWLEGETIKGNISVGDLLDLTFFQLNIFLEIKEIKKKARIFNRVGDELVSLRINLNEKEEKLVNQYLPKPAREIMVLKNV